MRFLRRIVWPSAADLGLEESPQDLIQREQRLIKSVADATQQWANVEKGLQNAQASIFNDKIIQELRDAATEARISALAQASSMRVGDSDHGIYKPIYDIFLEMMDISVETSDSVLRACDSRNPEGLETAISSARYCQSLGEQALMMIPELAESRREAEKDQERGCYRVGVWVCVGSVILVVLLTFALSTCD